MRQIMNLTLVRSPIVEYEWISKAERNSSTVLMNSLCFLEWPCLVRGGEQSPFGARLIKSEVNKLSGKFGLVNFTAEDVGSTRREPRELTGSRSLLIGVTFVQLWEKRFDLPDLEIFAENAVSAASRDPLQTVGRIVCALTVK